MTTIPSPGHCNLNTWPLPLPPSHTRSRIRPLLPNHARFPPLGTSLRRRILPPPHPHLSSCLHRNTTPQHLPVLMHLEVPMRGTAFRRAFRRTRSRDKRREQTLSLHRRQLPRPCPNPTRSTLSDSPRRHNPRHNSRPNYSLPPIRSPVPSSRTLETAAEGFLSANKLGHSRSTNGCCGRTSFSSRAPYGSLIHAGWLCDVWIQGGCWLLVLVGA